MLVAPGKLHGTRDTEEGREGKDALGIFMPPPLLGREAGRQVEIIKRG